MCLPAGFSLLSFGFAIWHLVHGKFEDALICFIAGGILGAFAYGLHQMEKATEEFLRFLAENRERINAGETLQYRGAPISLQTEVTQFFVCISVVLFTTKIPTKFYVRGHENTFLVGWVCSVMTFFLGWWGFPWGPIYTLQSFYLNARGGSKEKISQIMPRLEELIAKQAQEQAAEEAKKEQAKQQAEVAGPAPAALENKAGPWS